MKNWLLRTFGVSFNGLGIWWNDRRRGSTHLIRWPFIRKELHVVPMTPPDPAKQIVDAVSDPQPSAWAIQEAEKVVKLWGEKYEFPPSRNEVIALIASACEICHIEGIEIGKRQRQKRLKPLFDEQKPNQESLDRARKIHDYWMVDSLNVEGCVRTMARNLDSARAEGIEIGRQQEQKRFQAVVDEHHAL